jgi:hypothetical protein
MIHSVIEVLFQSCQGAMLPVVHGRDRNPEHPGGVGIGKSFADDQTEDLVLPFGKVLAGTSDVTRINREKTGRFPSGRLPVDC